MKSRTFLMMFITALVVGAAINWVDSRPNLDDPGLTAGVIFVSTLMLGFLDSKWAWLWALAVGGWIPVVGFLITHNPASILALIIALIGAFTGALGRKFVSSILAIR